MTEEIPAVSQTVPPRGALSRWMRRFGCLFMIIVWLGLMTLPCIILTLVVEKEILISRSDLPDHKVRLFLIEDTDNRGLGFSWGNISDGGGDEGAYCIITTVNYLMWKGSGDPVAYCSCYENTGEWSSLVPGDYSDCVLP